MLPNLEQVARILIEANANIEAVNNQCGTAIMASAAAGHEQVYSHTRSLRKQESQNPLQFLKVSKAQPGRPLEFLKPPRP